MADNALSQSPGFVYFISAHTGPIKIGFSVHPEKRLATMQTGAVEPYYLLATCPGSMETEKAYHRRFREHRVRGEWFSGSREILNEIERFNPACFRIQDWTDDDV